MWNARSLKNINNFNQFRTLLNTFIPGYDIIVLCESWFDMSSTNFDIYSLNGYSHEKLTRKNQKGGGVSVYIRDNMNYRIKSTFNGCFQKIVIEIMLLNEWTKFIAYYRPPQHSNLDNFLLDVEYECDDNMPTIIVGDINIDVNKPNEKTCSNYQSLLESYDAVVINDLITRPASSSIIDHIIVKKFPYVSDVSTIINSKSDHNMLSFSIRKPFYPSSNQIIYRQFIDYNIVSNHFSLNEHELLSISDPSEQLSTLVCKIKSAITAGSVTKRFKLSNHVKIAPFYNCEILGLLRWKENVFNKIRKLKKEKKPYDKLTSKIEKINEKLVAATDKAVTAYYDELFNNDDIKKIWNGINQVIGNKSKHKKIKLIEKGCLISDDTKTASTFKLHFDKISKSLDAGVDHTVNFNKFSTLKRIEKSLFLLPTDPSEIQSIIKNLTVCKASGFDGISVKIVKLLCEELSGPLSLLINNILDSSIYPDALKVAIVHPIYKRDGDKNDKDNYRPISVLSILNKIVEIVLLDRLENFLTKNGVFDKNQFSFRKKSGTDLALTELFHHINSALEKKRMIGLVFVDIKKAFDSINHRVLLEKLELNGIRGHALKLMNNYLSNRRQAVRIGESLSDWSDIDKGIGQGTNLGPILFNLYMNDLNNLPMHCKMIRYADDVALLFSFAPDDYNTFTAAVKIDMLTLENFHKVNGMSINPKKSKFMIVHRKSQTSKVIRQNIAIDNTTEIQQTDSHKYLGLVIDENATLDLHVEGICNKITPVVNILSRLKWTLPKHVLMKVYLAHIQSHLYYVPSIYGLTSKENLEPIQKLQNRALKHVFKLPVLTSTVDLFEKHAINILPIKGIIFHATTNLVNKIDKNIITTNIPLPKLPSTSRRSDQFSTIKFVSDFIKRDISYHGVQCFNKLPRDTRLITNQDKFKAEVKKILLCQISPLLNLNKFSLLDIF